jgi:hypothetical protein
MSSQTTKRSRAPLWGALFGVAAVAVFLYSILPALTSVSYKEPALIAAPPAVEPLSAAKEEPTSAHVPPPKDVKAIYMSQCVVGTPSFRNSLVQFIDESELNSVVIDIKDYTGKIAFPTDNPVLADAVSDACGARDMREFIATLHQKNIYVIGRITVFQSPYYTKLHPEQAVQKKGGGVWKDNKGLAFVDVGAKDYWGYVVELGKESYAMGFDELNFDYIRFPSDGPMQQAVYSFDDGKPKAQVLEEFFKYLTDQLRPTGAVLSADLFGMTATSYDDLGIGQVLERALPYFDYVYPMVYPSHYPSGFNGYKDVNAHSYDIVKFAMDTAVKRAQATTTTVPGLAFTPIASTSPQLYSKPVYSADKIRPWLQSFDYPVTYTPAMVESQIKAANDAGLQSWAFWDAGNKYNALRRALAE